MKTLTLHREIDTYIFIRSRRFLDREKVLTQVVRYFIVGLFPYLSNGEDDEDMVIFAKSHKEFLRPYAALPNGIPSHDTFRRVFSLESISEEWEYDHGRYEVRKCSIIPSNRALFPEAQKTVERTENPDKGRIKSANQRPADYLIFVRLPWLIDASGRRCGYRMV